MVEEEINQNEEKKSNKMSFIERYKFVLAGIFIVGLILFSWTQGFNETNMGTISLILAIATICIIAISIYKPSPLILSDEYAKDPFYYYNFMKNYYTKSIIPRLSIDFTWSGKFTYYPETQPSLIFFELYDRLNQEPLIGIVRIMKGSEQVRGLIKGTWEDFMRYKIYRLKMAGWIPSSANTMTIIGKDGKPINAPAEVIQALYERGGLF